MQKNILLSPEEGSQIIGNMPRGILSIESADGQLRCKLRTYNANFKPNDSRVGIYHRGKVFESVLKTADRGYFTFETLGNFDLGEDIYFAVISEGRVNLCGGTYANSIVDIKEYFFRDNAGEPNHSMQGTIKKPIHSEQAMNTEPIYMEKNKATEPIDSYYTVPDEKDTDSRDYDSVAEEDISRFFMSQEVKQKLNTIANNDKPADKETERLQNDENISNDEKNSFFRQLNVQFDELFSAYPIDDALNKIVPESKFVRIDDDESGSYYVLGLLYDNGEVKYLAYGLPSTYDISPPEEMRGKCQWLPKDVEDPLSDGYYILYQDAHSGKIVNIDIS